MTVISAVSSMGKVPPEQASGVRRTFELVTKNRQALVDLGVMLAQAGEGAKTLTVALNGEFDGGKSVIADSARQFLMSTASRVAFRGEWRTQEHWYGKRDGVDVEFSFTNMSRLICNSRDEALRGVLAERKFSGTAFFSNSRYCKTFMPDVGVWLFENLCDEQVTTSALAKSFMESGSRAPWDRFVRVEVAGNRGQAVESFAAAMEEICAAKNNSRHASGVTLSNHKTQKMAHALRTYSGYNRLRLLQWGMAS